MVTSGAHIGRTSIPLAWLVAASLASSACLEPRAGVQAGREDGDGADADTDAANDTALADAAVTPDTSREDVGPVDTCEPGLALAERGAVIFEPADMAAPSIPLDGSTLLGTRRVEVDGAVRHRVVAVDLPSGRESVVVESASALSLIDARGGAALVMRLDYAGGVTRTSLAHLALDDGREVTLFSGASGAGGAIVPSAMEWGAAPRLVEGDVAVWAEQTYGTGAGGAPQARVRRLRDGRIETLWEERADVAAPYLLAGRALWATRGEGAALWLAEPTGGARPIARGALGGYALTVDAAWWIADGAVTRRDLATGDERRVHDGPCALLASDARSAAAVCGPEVGSGDWFMAVAGTPFSFRGTEVTALGTAGGDLIAALRVEGQRVAWVEYPSGAGCSFDELAVGALVVARLDAPTQAASLVRMGAGCWCCNAWWPPPALALVERGLAWNYPIGDGVDPVVDRGAAIGWALWSDACR